MESLAPNSVVRFSSDLSRAVRGLNTDSIPRTCPEKLVPLLQHLKSEASNSIRRLEDDGAPITIVGPDWCRGNSSQAGVDHSEVILKTYGSTYALPNKDPKANMRALQSGELDMYLMYKDERPVGTACMVFQDNGWAELGRAASLGRVGNKLIQHLRLIRWMTEENMAQRSIGLFATCRTAPDRNVGTVETPQIMRGGQAVSHMWAEMPGIMVGGFGPLYKKHGALEQFAYTFATNRDAYLPEQPFIVAPENYQFVQSWRRRYSLPLKRMSRPREISSDQLRFSPGYPPVESGITQLVHGEVHISDSNNHTTLLDALTELDDVRVPFTQVQVPIDHDSGQVQLTLAALGFQAFLLTPGIDGHQSPLLWFGKKRSEVEVVPTYWQQEGSENLFWPVGLAVHARRIALGW